MGTVAGWTAHAGYNVLAFFAYWFGAARFDANGDGEFDPADVQRMINNLSRHMRFSFSRPRPRGRRLRERLHAQRERQQRAAEAARQRALEHEENMRRIRNAMDQEQGDAPARRPSVASNLSAQLHVERALHAASRAADAIQATIEAPVEGECVEQTVGDNLRQFWPWFSIGQILVCFGLWLGYALQTNVYALRASHALFDEAVVVESLEGVGTPYECQIACSSRGDACAAVVFREGLHPECRLLSERPQDVRSVPSCQVQRSWSWILYEKQPRTIGNLLGAFGGLETAYPGATSLQSGSYCQDGYATGVLWRLLGYQFTHGGLFHVGGNCLLILFFGVPLEGFHGTGLTAIMHTIGVVGGGLAWLLLDPYTKVYGASGGCYALLGMQLADLVLNWRQKKFRFPMLFMLGLLVTIETAGYASAVQGAMTTTAHAVHLGGLISGFIVGMLLTYNIEKTRRERALQVVTLLVGLGLACFALAYWFGNPFPGIRSLLTTGEDPVCWIGQVCTNEDGTGCDYSQGWQCVTCDTRECVENWYKDEDVFCVALGNREICGDRYEDVVHNCVNC